MNRDLMLMRLHLEALFVHDESGRMVQVNVAELIDAPRFFLGRTRSGVIVRFGVGLPNEIADRLSALAESESNGLATKDPVHAAEYLKVLETQAPVTNVFWEQAFTFPEESTTDDEHGAVQITEDNADLLRGGFEEWLGDVAHAQPFLAIVDGGRAVSVCASVRITSEAHECGIETLTDFRGRGLAVRAAAAWAVHIRRLGIVPLYSTHWDNIASQHLAAKLGCLHFGSDFYVS